MRLFRALANLLQRRGVERDLDDELRAHAALLTDEYAARGMPAEEARRAALAEIGGLESVKEQVREVRAGARLDTLTRDIVFGLRTFRRAPAFALVAILTLAIGIGATATMFSVLDAVVLAPLPYPGADRVAFLWNHFSPQNAERGTLCFADLLDWHASNNAFEEPSAYRRVVVDLTSLAPPEQVAGAEVTDGFFSTLDVAPLLGRTFRQGEGGLSSPALAVISESLWRRRFDASPTVVGRPVSLDGVPALIVGVMPAAFSLPSAGVEIWRNLRLAPPTRRGPFNLVGIGRLKDGVTWAQAQDDANRVAHSIEMAHPDVYHRATMPILPIREALVGDARRSIVVLFGAVGMVLLIACVNVANLQLARGTSRRREIALRLSLGARRSRIVRQLLTESAILAIGGGIAGTALAWWGVGLAQRLGTDTLPRLTDARMSLHVFAFVAVVCVASTLIFGIVPALDGARDDVFASLKSGGRGSAAAPESGRVRRALVVTELILSTVLLVCGGLLLRSFARLVYVDSGVHEPLEQILTLLVSPPATRYSDAASQVSFFNRALENVRAVPGVTGAAFADSLAPVYWTNGDTFHIPGQPWSQERFPSAPLPTVSADYFRTMGVSVLRGRTFDQHDAAKSSLVAVVSQTFVNRYFPAADPIGQLIAPSSPQMKQPLYRIVGVVGDVKFSGLQSLPEPVWYSALAQSPDIPMFLFVRTSRPIEGTLRAVEQAVRNVDPGVIFSHERTLAEVVHEAVAQPRLRAGLFVAFAAIALLLAATGTYGVVAYSVAQRTQEIGVRMALGATPGDIARLVLGEAGRLVGLGIALGVPAAAVGATALRSLLFATRATDVQTYCIVIAILTLAVAWAASAPVLRAARIDPLIALRAD